jgi:hypothetical protein
MGVLTDAPAGMVWRRVSDLGAAIHLSTKAMAYFPQLQRIVNLATWLKKDERRLA